MGTRLDFHDLEALALETRTRARVDDEDVVRPGVMAVRLLGRDGLHRMPRLSATGMLIPVEGRYRIFVRRNVPDEAFVIAHELGHWSLRNIGYSGPDEERFADYVGAAIMAPPKVVRWAYRRFGESLGEIARVFHATQSMIVLRLAEVLGDERALVSPRDVRVRSAGRFHWPSASELRAWRDGRTPPGVQRAALRGAYDAGRVAFRAA
jgi:hypothetical protein